MAEPSTRSWKINQAGKLPIVYELTLPYGEAPTFATTIRCENGHLFKFDEEGVIKSGKRVKMPVKKVPLKVPTGQKTPVKKKAAYKPKQKPKRPKYDALD